MKRFLTIILIFTLIISVATVGSAATLKEIFSGKEITLSTVNEKLPELTAYTVARFPDVEKAAWYINSVSKLTGLRGIEGYPDGTFKPQGITTTAEFTKLLLAGMGYIQSETAVKWYDNYVSKAKELGVIEASDNYDYDSGMKRVYMAKMICKMLKLQSKKSDKTIFTDTNGTDTTWIDTAFEEFLIRGYYSKGIRTFKPEQTATRAEVSEMIMRALEYRQNPQMYKQEKEAAFKKEDELQDQADAIEDGLRNGTLQNINGFITKVPQKNSSLLTIEGSDISKMGKDYPVISITIDRTYSDINLQYKETQDILSQKIENGVIEEAINYAKTKEEGLTFLKFKEFITEGDYYVSVISAPGSYITISVYYK